MYEIIPNLFLTSYPDLLSHYADKDVDGPSLFIVNCTKTLPMFRNHRGFRVEVDDDKSPAELDRMFKAFPQLVNLIDAQLSQGKRVIVHCQAGQQRSPAVIAAYLMAKKGHALHDAVAYIKQRKPDAFFWSANFMGSLDRYALQLQQ